MEMNMPIAEWRGRERVNKKRYERRRIVFLYFLEKEKKKNHHVDNYIM